MAITRSAGNTMNDNNLWDDVERVFHGDVSPRVSKTRYWTDEDMARLVKLAEAQATTRQIALELRRSPLAVRLKASRMGLSLTAHEVRRSARRHAKRQGGAAMAELKSARRRPRIAMTVDFDLSSLTRHERSQLAERLRVMEMEEAGVAPAESTQPDAPISPRRRSLRVPEAYDPSKATSKRHRESNAKRAANRKSLGWTSSRPDMNEEAQLSAARVDADTLGRHLLRRARRGKGPKSVSLESVAGEVANRADPLAWLKLESFMNDPHLRARVEELEGELGESEAMRLEPPSEGEEVW